ncbi:hypothetical protein SAMN05421544_11042 [Riemerella columbipharyngis]|uniref:Uncharacterized protein n=2 Tax=Riemerella columbipharyngis TaxID=1071918 RepID=A0A1G7D7Z7_9FLAO|nr:hypothetical protein SAMN05421544_11042 [Riemerella columbipharyngis]
MLMITFQQVAIIVHFKLNQDYIEKKYCVNKNTPTTHCHGKCRLRKELENTQKESPKAISIYKTFDLVPTTTYNYNFENKEPVAENTAHHFYKEKLTAADYNGRLFKPPIF